MNCCQCAKIDYLPNAKYCHICGGLVALKCTKSQHSLTIPTAKYCDQCGTPIIQETKNDTSLQDEKMLQFLLRPIEMGELLDNNEPFMILMEILFPKKNLVFAGRHFKEESSVFVSGMEAKKLLQDWWTARQKTDIDECLEISAELTRQLKQKGLAAEVFEKKILVFPCSIFFF